MWGGGVGGGGRMGGGGGGGGCGGPGTGGGLGAWTGLGGQGGNAGVWFAESIRVGVQAVLLSPHFLFRAEPVARAAEAVSVHELASRLSYFLWSSMPDDLLAQAADDGSLRRPEVLRAQVKRMLADSRSDAVVENFAGQWLGVRGLDKRQPDPKHFPGGDDEMVGARARGAGVFEARGVGKCPRRGDGFGMGLGEGAERLDGVGRDRK